MNQSSLNHFGVVAETCAVMSRQEIVLKEGSRVFESWKNPPPPVFMEFFFFNVTNADQFLAGAKPAVTQVGPYTYRYGDGAFACSYDCTGRHKPARKLLHAYQEVVSYMQNCWCAALNIGLTFRNICRFQDLAAVHLNFLYHHQHKPTEEIFRRFWVRLVIYMFLL